MSRGEKHTLFGARLPATVSNRNALRFQHKPTRRAARDEDLRACVIPNGITYLRQRGTNDRAAPQPPEHTPQLSPAYPNLSPTPCDARTTETTAFSLTSGIFCFHVHPRNLMHLKVSPNGQTTPKRHAAATPTTPVPAGQRGVTQQ